MIHAAMGAHAQTGFAIAILVTMGINVNMVKTWNTLHMDNFMLPIKCKFFSQTLFEISCSISDKYTKLLGKFCMGNDIASYTTLQAAKAACANNTECDCIHDYECNGDIWIIGNGSDISSSNVGSCAWTGRPGKFTFLSRFGINKKKLLTFQLLLIMSLIYHTQ